MPRKAEAGQAPPRTARHVCVGRGPPHDDPIAPHSRRYAHTSCELCLIHRLGPRPHPDKRQHIRPRWQRGGPGGDCCRLHHLCGDQALVHALRRSGGGRLVIGPAQDLLRGRSDCACVYMYVITCTCRSGNVGQLQCGDLSILCSCGTERTITQI